MTGTVLGSTTTRRAPPVAGVLVAIAAITGACNTPDFDDRYSEARQPCAEYNKERTAYWGDLHLHTGLSFDAWVYGNHLTPGDAYRFAKGESIKIPPLDAQGNPTRELQLARPLDFAMVSDHAEFLGETRLCTTPGSPAYDSTICTSFRAGGENAVTFFGTQTSLYPPTRFDLCGAAEPDCYLAALDESWEALQDAAETAYDRSSRCEFASFVGYEYTNTTDVVNLHRNVIFRNARVLHRPISVFEANTPYALWRALRDDCLEAGYGCEVMTIGHNANLSNGHYYGPYYDGATSDADQAEAAALRRRLEPLTEIFQHKGDMECRNGFATGDATDPLCDFEKQRPPEDEDCGDDTGGGGMRLWGCVSRYDFVRGALKLGLSEQRRIGINPYEFGILASTDTHNGIAGYTQEQAYYGHVGDVDDSPLKRLGEGDTITHDTLVNNPGGLAGVWAEERSRDAIWEALQRREVFGSSGPRIPVRLFGGWEFDAEICTDPAWVTAADADGVPMGAVLPQAPASAGAPSFVVWAQADPGPPEYPGAPLQRLQIIKGWLDAAGDSHAKVFEVAGDAQSTATVDASTCEPQGDGFDELCTVWTDPEFDPSEPAFYYLRALENPTCRWSTFECLRLAPADRPPQCNAMPSPIKPIIQERAWSSPIWYGPPD